MMSPFPAASGLSLLDGQLFVENVALRDLAKRYGTPLYVYSKKALSNAISDWKENLKKEDAVYFAVKANCTRAILKEFVDNGMGLDIVSGGELLRALASGVDSQKIYFSGVGKTEDEIRLALTKRIGCFNVESESELYRISNCANEMKCLAPIALRINPDVDAKTHPYISTGLKENKFGIDYSEAVRLYKVAATLPGIRIVGISSHIGSQILSVTPFVDALEKILHIVKTLENEGIFLSHIDVGGGLGVTYTDEKPPLAKELVAALHQTLQTHGITLPLSFEPGRNLVAHAGVLLSEVQYLKPTPQKNFCIVDAAMNDMIRPALYEATMPLYNTIQRNEKALVWDIVGPVCESGDWLYKGATLAVRPGDVLVMPSAGAYGASMSSNYNSRLKAAEVLVDGDTVKLIRQRETFEDLIRNEL